MKHIFFIASMLILTAQAKVLEIDGQQDLDANIAQNKNVVIKFYRPGCPACRDIDAAYNRVSDNISNVTFLSIDTSKPNNRTVFPQWGVKGVPALFFIKNGEKTEYKKDRSFSMSFEKAVKDHFGK